MIFDFAPKLRPRRIVARVVGSQPEQVMFLRNMVDVYRHAPAIREWAVDVVRTAGIPPRRRISQALAIARWVQRNCYYVNEGDEEFATPVQMLRQRFEDCDGFTALIASGLEAIGIDAQLVAMWMANPPRGVLARLERAGMPWQLTRSGSYKHIFPRAVIPKPGGGHLKLPLDATLNRPAGTVDPVRMAVARGDKVKLLVL